MHKSAPSKIRCNNKSLLGITGNIVPDLTLLISGSGLSNVRLTRTTVLSCEFVTHVTVKLVTQRAFETMASYSAAISLLPMFLCCRALLLVTKPFRWVES